MIQEAPIFITGCSRSGMSMIAATINLCGAFGGEMSKRGRYSNDIIREDLVKVHLKTIGADPEGQYPLPIMNIVQYNWAWNVKKIMEWEGYKDGPWMYKDSRLALMWRIWHNAFPNAKWIIVRRRTGDVIQSCVKTGYMKAFKNPDICKAVNVKTEEEGWLWWVHQYEKYFIEMTETIVNCKQMWPERMLNGDYQQIKEVCEWVGLPWKDEALGFIDNLLWRSGKKERT